MGEIQQHLFDDPSKLTIDPELGQPALWVRSLRLMASETEPIREIDFRLGLNVIATRPGDPDDPSQVGHNVGKTLLTRFLRHCLGEDRYADSALMTKIGSHAGWADGFAEAVVCVSGTDWRVRRPFVDGETAVWRGKRKATWAKYQQEIVAASSPAEDQTWDDWLDLLAWLARDQHCRYRDRFEWRSDDRPINQARATYIVRSALELASPEERDLISRREQVSQTLSQLKEQRTALRSAIAPQRDLLARVLAPSGQSELSGLAREVMDERLRELDDREQGADEEAGVVEAKELLRETGEELDAIATAIFGHIKGRSRAEGKIDIHQQKPTVDRSTCPLRSEDCPDHHTETSAPTDAADDAIEKQRKILKMHVDSLAELEEKRTRTVAQQTARRARLRDCEATAARIRGEVAVERAKIEAVRSAADEIDGEEQSLATLDQSIVETETQQRTLRDEQRAMRETLTLQKERMDGHFAAVLSHLFGASFGYRIGGTIDTLRLLSAAELPGGEAISTASQVLAFDLAALRASLAGVGHLPRLHILDSPREADMDAALYRRLFSLLMAFEQACGDEPAFQVFVTTTTPPPAECPIVLKLAGEDSGRLLRVWL